MFRTIHWTRRSTLLVAPAVVAAVVWFVTLPEPRFAGALFWHIGAALCVAAIACPHRLPRGRVLQACTAAAVVLYVAISSRGGDILTISPAGTPPARAKLGSFTTESGLIVHVPLGDDRCLSAPLPCTPTPTRDLRLRRSGDLGSGFTRAAPR